MAHATINGRDSRITQRPVLMCCSGTRLRLPLSCSTTIYGCVCTSIHTRESAKAAGIVCCLYALCYSRVHICVHVYAYVHMLFACLCLYLEHSQMQLWAIVLITSRITNPQYNRGYATSLIFRQTANCTEEKLLRCLPPKTKRAYKWRWRAAVALLRLAVAFRWGR